jgi:hypothetical protein
MNLPTLSHAGIQLSAIPELAGAEIFRDFADTLLDVILAQMQRAALCADSPDRHVHMRMLGVVVGDCYPFKGRAEVLLHPRDEIAGQPFQVRPIVELRGYNQLPEALIAGFLPAFEPFRDVDGLSAIIKPNRLGIAFVNGALTGDIAPIGSPLSGDGVLRVDDPHRASLIVGSSALSAVADSDRPAFPTPAHASVMHQDFIG